jgi:predicted nucleic acid-binding protein
VILLDTNLLTRLTSTGHPHGSVARAAIQRLIAQKEQIAIVPQNLYEFWAPSTAEISRHCP